MTHVGKRIHGRLYIEAITAAYTPQRLIGHSVRLRLRVLLRRAVREHITLHIAAIDLDDSGTVLLQLNSLQEPHPHAIAAYKIPYVLGPLKPHLADYRVTTTRQIFHRMDAILSPLNPQWPYYRAVTAWEESRGLLGQPDQPKSIGYREEWERWIQQHMPLTEYEQNIARIAREHTARRALYEVP